MNKLFRILLCLTVIITIVSCAGTFTVGNLVFTPVIQGSNLSLGITGTNAGYIGLGFGTSMSNVDMIMISSSGTTVSAVDCWSVGHSAPKQDTTIAGQNNVSITGTYASGAWSVTLIRPLIASDAFDAAILTTGAQPFTVALGSTMIITDLHTSYIVMQANFSNPALSNVNATKGASPLNISIIATSFILFLFSCL